MIEKSERARKTLKPNCSHTTHWWSMSLGGYLDLDLDLFPSSYRRGLQSHPLLFFLFLSITLTHPGSSHRSLVFLSRSRRVHVLPRTRAHNSTWLAEFTCVRKRREPTPSVPATRHLHMLLSILSSRRAGRIRQTGKRKRGRELSGVG